MFRDARDHVEPEVGETHMLAQMMQFDAIMLIRGSDDDEFQSRWKNDESQKISCRNGNCIQKNFLDSLFTVKDRLKIPTIKEFDVWNLMMTSLAGCDVSKGRNRPL
jgi:hypothetical protein